jgi:hypothetical protein
MWKILNLYCVMTISFQRILSSLSTISTEICFFTSSTYLTYINVLFLSDNLVTTLSKIYLLNWTFCIDYLIISKATSIILFFDNIEITFKVNFCDRTVIKTFYFWLYSILHATYLYVLIETRYQINWLYLLYSRKVHATFLFTCQAFSSFRTKYMITLVQQ